MKATGKLVDVTITTDRERYYSCPAVQEALRDGAMHESNPFEKIAGTKLRIHSVPVEPGVGAFAKFCELTHWPVWIGDSLEFGHDSNSWVCPHMVDIPD